jgi:tetratricopeptide (TPR) repeat protein
VGKSRLVAELFAYIDSKPELVNWRQGRCLPYGDGITFWALGEIVKAHAGIYESDPPETAQEKLEAVLREGEDRAWLRARLLPLLGIDSGVAASREESFTAWRRFLEGVASDGPTVIVVEDIHWADPALLDFITHLAEWAEGVPLLVLCTARPELYERHPAWAGGMRNATTINLAPLSDRETAELVSGLLAQTVLTEGVEQAILERAGGNPLYAEEFVRLIADRGLDDGGDGLAFPDSVQALIAARLDTLLPERKSLLQDAAVLGKVFWAAALVEMGDRDPRELEHALHELSRKELVRPMRASSMEGEAEYSFWHLLVRDIAYAQIPRKERVRRHRAAAGWIERKAGERVEDLAELLAHHYLAAVEQAEAAGETEEAEALAVPACRFLALAGERALGLDSVQAEARLARALELCPIDDQERPDLLLRWARAAYEIGLIREATSAAEEALAAFREWRQDEATSRALILLAQMAHRQVERRFVALAAEAASLLEEDEPGEALVHAYAEMTTAHFLAGNHEEALAVSERALALAERLGLPPPARVLAYRGAARADLGHEEGIAEMEQAVELLVEQGAGQSAATLKNNLALARYALEGPARTLAAFEEAIDFSRRRGLETVTLECNCPWLLADLGRPEQALENVSRLAPLVESSGAKLFLVELRLVEAAVRTERGDAEPVDIPWLVDAAREFASVDQVVTVLAVAAVATRQSNPERASAFLTSLEQTTSARDSSYYPRLLPTMVRTAISVDDVELGGRLIDDLKPLYPLHEHALCATRAQLAEAADDHVEAAALYAEAAERWREFGNVPERAYALLGHGRCLYTLGDPAAEQPLRQAAGLFSSMGYRPALAETEALIDHVGQAS